MADKRFMRGARPTPAHKILAARRHLALVAPPSQVAMIPKQLDMWGNDHYGDCVTAEEAFAIAAYSVLCGNPERFVTTSNVIAWARKHGFLDGADLVEVMDAETKDPLVDSAGNKDKDGPYFAVDYSSETDLQSAISQGPVKIAIDANALPDGAGNNQGWFATGKGRFPNTDHCVSLAGYGPSAWLYQQLGVPLPSGLSGKSGYLLFTWSTIGFVDHDWLMGTCVESWLRTPTTVGESPAPSPNPTPTPTPNPSGGIPFGESVTFNQNGTYVLGASGPGIDPAKLIAAINALLALFGLPPLPASSATEIMSQSPRVIPWGKVIRIGILLFGWVSTGANPAMLPALIQQIIAIIQG